MRFEIETKKLAAELDRFLPIVAAKMTIPALAHLKLTTDAAGLTIEATDLDTSLRATIEAEETRFGVACVPGRELAAIAKAADAETLTLEHDGSRIAITAGRSRWRLPAIDAENFPKIPEAPASEWAVAGATLAAALGRTSYAMTEEGSRYTLGGVLFEFRGSGLLRLVATDGHRCAIDELAVEGGNAVKALLPRRGTAALAKLATDAERIEIGCGLDGFGFVVGARVMTARKLAGNFPNYELFLPATDEWKETEVPSAALLAALDRVTIVSRAVDSLDRADRPVRLAFTGSTLAVSVKPSKGDGGEASEEIALAMPAGLDAAFVVQSRYLADCIRRAAGETVRFAVKSSEDVVAIRDTQSSMFGIVMPYRDVNAKPAAAGKGE